LRVGGSLAPAAAIEPVAPCEDRMTTLHTDSIGAGNAGRIPESVGVPEASDAKGMCRRIDYARVDEALRRQMPEACGGPTRWGMCVAELPPGFDASELIDSLAERRFALRAGKIVYGNRQCPTRCGGFD